MSSRQIGGRNQQDTINDEDYFEIVIKLEEVLLRQETNSFPCNDTNFR